jgi:hypothetical protein
VSTRRLPQSPTEVLAIKQAVRERDGMRCTGCGMTNTEHLRQYGRALDVHRTTPGSLYALDDSCVTLCRLCHGPQPRRKRGQPDLANGYLIFARVRPDLRDAWKAYLSSLQPRCTSAAALEVAIEDFLAARGFWPPPGHGPTP